MLFQVTDLVWFVDNGPSRSGSPRKEPTLERFGVASLTWFTSGGPKADLAAQSLPPRWRKRCTLQNINSDSAWILHFLSQPAFVGILTCNSLDRYDSAGSKCASVAKQCLPVANIWPATAHVWQGQMQYVLKGSPAVVCSFHRSCGWIFNEKLLVVRAVLSVRVFLIIANNFAGKEHSGMNTH